MITIITVCYNAAADLEKTIISVLQQRNCEIEYIIKDGGSIDETKAVVEMYQTRLQQLRRFIFVSEKDTGLYEAMNIATTMARGERILYLNSGDCFYDEDVVAFVESLERTEDIIYGDMIRVVHDRQEYCPANPENIEDFKRKMNFSHQAAFIKTHVMQELLYDTNYGICADYEFFLRAYDTGKTFKHIERTIVLFQIGGISYQRSFDLLDETYHIQCKYGILTKKECSRLCKKNQFKKCIRQLIPSRIYQMLKSWKLKNRKIADRGTYV